MVDMVNIINVATRNNANNAPNDIIITDITIDRNLSDVGEILSSYKKNKYNK